MIYVITTIVKTDNDGRRRGAGNPACGGQSCPPSAANPVYLRLQGSAAQETIGPPRRRDKIAVIPSAGMTELADVPDSKSGALHWACGFNSHSRHHISHLTGSANQARGEHNLDERIEALTRNVELIASMHQDLDKKWDGRMLKVQDMLERVTEMNREMVRLIEIHDERLNSHDDRLDNLEH